MSESEPSPAVRRLFEELEAEFEASLRREAEQEAVAALRAQAAETSLWESLARRVGTEIVVRAGTRMYRGTLLASYPDFFVVRASNRSQHLIRLSPTISVWMPADRQRLRPLAPAPRYRFVLALRELARRREPVRLELADENAVDGTVQLVGSDYLELAEHDLAEPCRGPSITGRRLVGIAAVVVVSLLPEHR
jgi:hypothetical protein